MTQDLEKLKEWIGQKETDVDYVTVPTVHRLAATLDLDYPTPKMGDTLPVGWYHIFFPRVVRQSQCGPDGHPARGDFLPPVPLPRRMFAGRRVRFLNDLRVGDEMRRESTIKGVTVKQGRTGQMVFVTVQTDIASPRGLAITEEQDIVYREAPEPGAPPPAPQPAPARSAWSSIVTPDEVMLFRYSAITFNGHRIHYDHPYVTGTEGYPGLVMNGGLTTLLTGELARLNSKRPLSAITSRNVRPMFANRPITFGGEPSADGTTAKLWAADDTGALALTAEAEFR
jgi:3-methylfumaryl-CoA hydratase